MSWGRVTGLADAQTDGAERRVGHNACKQLAQALKRVRLQAGQIRIHGRHYP